MRKSLLITVGLALALLPSFASATVTARTIVNPMTNSAVSSAVMRNELQILENEITNIANAVGWTTINTLSGSAQVPTQSGGTGNDLTPTYGQVLVGTSGGIFSLMSTSSLGISGSGSSASSTLLSDNNTFSGGNLFVASTTIGNGNQKGGLTVSGGATTTGNAYFAGNVGVGTNSFTDKLDVNGAIGLTTTVSSLPTNGFYTSTINSAINPLPSIGMTTRDGTKVLQFLTSDQVGNPPVDTTALGYGTLANWTAAGSNGPETAVGLYALNAITTGDHNTALGDFALADTQTGSHNTALGIDALRTGTTLNSAVAVGEHAFTYANAAYGSTGLGTAAGFYLATSSYDTAIGFEALQGISGDMNDSTTSNNTAVGAYALSSIDGTSNYGYSDDAFGYQALQHLSTGVYDEAFGNAAGYNLTTADYDTFMGQGAGSNVTTGQYNVFINSNSVANSSGAATCIGISDICGNNDTVVGSFSHVSLNAQYAEESSLGSYAFYADTSGSHNSGIGYFAGYANTTGSNNLFLGWNTASTSVSGSNNIALGYDVALPSTNGSNQLDIGNLIFGTGINGQGTTVSTGNVGIASTTPGSLLSVGGSGAGINFGTATSTFTNVGGINLTTGCFAIAGTCISGGGGSGTVTSVTLATPNSTLTLGGTNPVTTSGTINADLNLGNGNVWTAASTTFNGGVTIKTATTTSATTTNLYVSGTETLGGSTGAVSAASGVLSVGTLSLGNGGTGATSCATSGGLWYYTGSVFACASGATYSSTGNSLLTVTNASTTNLTGGSSNPFSVWANGEIEGYDFLTGFQGQISPTRYIAFKLSTSTNWTSTSSASSVYGDAAQIVMPFSGTMRTLSCGTSAGTLEIEASVNSNNDYYPASTTAGTYTFSNTFSKGQIMTVIAGAPASSPTYSTCTLGATQTP